MNIQYLKYAVEVARIGSISRAAEELYIAQPNLSRAIKELEKDLGITIFDRNSKGMTLTHDGERLVEYGKAILRQINEVENAFKGQENEKKSFSISVPRASYISSAFAEFSKCLEKEGNFEIFYKETNALRAINNILEKDYKLGIVRYAAQYDKYFKEMAEQRGLNHELISEFHRVLVFSKTSALNELDEIRFSDLKNYIEIAHADPFVPSLPLAEVRKDELQGEITRRIFVFERGSQFDVLSKNDETFMWVSPVPFETLERYGLTAKPCAENAKVYKDVLIYKKDYHLTALDKTFITKLCEAKRSYL